MAHRNKKILTKKTDVSDKKHAISFIRFYPLVVEDAYRKNF
jgi:hypothetical protein